MGTEAIAALVPHAGGMCLLERVLDWDETRIRLSTASHRSPSNPLRRAGRLRSIHLCEYGAQAMAVHGGLLARAAGMAAPARWLVSLRSVEFAIDFIETLDGELVVFGEQLADAAGSAQYAFTVSHGERVLARGRCAVITPPGV